jgi:hypothetical protein
VEVEIMSLGDRRETGFLLEIVIPSDLLKYLASVPMAKKPAKEMMVENNMMK